MSKDSEEEKIVEGKKKAESSEEENLECSSATKIGQST